MTCSELIAKLEYAKSIYGDLDIKMNLNTSYSPIDIFDIDMIISESKLSNYLTLLPSEDDTDKLENEVMDVYKEAINDEIDSQLDTFVNNFEGTVDVYRLKEIKENLTKNLSELTEAIDSIDNAIYNLHYSDIGIDWGCLY